MDPTQSSNHTKTKLEKIEHNLSQIEKKVDNVVLFIEEHPEKAKCWCKSCCLCSICSLGCLFPCCGPFLTGLFCRICLSCNEDSDDVLWEL